MNPAESLEPQVTLIVPVYNVEEYLGECLSSIARQTAGKNLRVIIVDDGSTDSSPYILAEHVARHPHVRLITQENGGLGAARNRGLAEVTTPFVMFCDSDDTLSPRAVELLLTGITTHDADIAIGRMRSFPTRTHWAWMRHLEDGKATLLHGIEEAPELIHGASVCNKIFRTEVLRERGLRFAERTHFEDVYVTLPVLLHADRIALVPYLVYNYRKRQASTSIMDSLWTREANYWDHLKVETFLATQRQELPEARRSVLDLFMVRSLQGFLLRAPEALSEDMLRQFFDQAVAVYRGIDPESVMAGCLNARHRLPFVALLTDDYDFFVDPGAHVTGMGAVEGTLTLLTQREVPAALLHLMVSDRVVAQLESVDRLPGGRALRVSGRMVIDGFVPSDSMPVQLGVRVRGSALTVPARAVQRTVRVAGRLVTTWSGFVADIPAKGLKDGEHVLRLVFITESGQASTRLRPTRGVRRSSRQLRMSGRRVMVRADRFDNASMLVGSTKTLRKRWALRGEALRDDLLHVRRRRPLWKARLVRTLTVPFFRGRNVWLLVERPDTAQDNSFFLFRYLRQHHRERDAYYVINENSPQRWKLAEYGHVVNHGSIQHRLLMLHARWLIGSYDIDSYLLPAGWSLEHYLRHLAWRVGSRRAFLQHGVTYNDVRSALHRSITGVDVFVTSSDREAEYVRSTMAYPTQVAVTGLPRFDNLTPVAGPRTVLLMPTWRSSLVSPSYAKKRPSARPFEGSDYQRFFRSLLNHEDLLAALDSHDVTLEVLPHYEFAGLVDDLIPQGRRVIVAHHSERDVQQAIRECSLFVTDWSSPFFDAAYLGVPQVLLPFDEKAFREDQYAEGYFDLDRDGFGPVARTVDEAVKAIVGYLQGGFVREPEYTARVAAFFEHRDENNSQRVMNAIDAATRPPLVTAALAADGVRQESDAPQHLISASFSVDAATEDPSSDRPLLSPS